MNGKKSTLIVFLITCMMAGQIISTYAADYRPHLQVTTANATFPAGSRGSMTITLRNDGNFDATEVEAILTSNTPGITPLNGAQKVVNSVDIGTSVSYTVDVFVDQAVATGAYVLTLSLNYLRGGVGVVTVTVPVPLIVDTPSLPSLRITPSTNKITPGMINTMHLTVENISPANVTSVNIALSSASTLISLSDIINYNVTKLTAGSSTSFDVSLVVLENTPIGAYTLTAQVWYVNSYRITAKQTISIPLEVSAVAVTRTPVVTVQNMGSGIVLPGETFTITLRVSCSGAPIYNARAVLGQDVTGLISPVSQTTVSLGDLGVDGSSTVSYTMLLSGSAIAADIPLVVSIKYLDSKGISGTATETISIPIENLVDFRLMKDIIVSAEKGKTTTLEGDLLLVGTGKVEFSSISIIPGGPVQRVTGSTEYIGAIDPDSPVPFTIRFMIDDDAQLGDSNLQLRITYLNSRNIQENRTISVPLQIVAPSPTVTPTNDDGGLWGWLRRLFGLQ